MTDFGIIFKTTREAKGLTLAQIARETRISLRYLEAIENEQFHLLPGGIFSRGFVRSYADRLGLDPEKTVTEFLRLSGDQDPVVMEEAPVSAPQKDQARRAWVPILIGVLILIVIVFYVVRRDRAGQPAENVTARINAAFVTLPPTPPSPATVAPTVAVEPIPAPEPTSASNSATDVLTIEIAATAEAWVKVTADGREVLPGEILQSGMTRRFPAQRSIALVVGNAGGITIKVNDHAISPLGQSGQVRFLTITPENLKSIIG
jgi:cytoskeleton protein RodZ